MKCIKCKKELPEQAVFCCWCGKKQIKTKQKRRKRAPGTGSITMLPNYKNPYMARLPRTLINGEIVQPLVGVFPTYADAEKALNRAIDMGNFDLYNMTLGDLWKRFEKSEYFLSLSKDGQGSHRAAWNYLKQAEGVKVADINRDTFQNIIRNMTYEKKVKKVTEAGESEEYEFIQVPHKRAGKLKVRNLASLLCKEAMAIGKMTVNYGQLVQLPPDDTEETLPFPPSVLQLLWKHRIRVEAQIILAWCYTGMRPNELFLLDVEDYHKGPPDYCVGGSKTEAGRNRIIPIPPIIKQFFDRAVGERSSGPLFLSANEKRIDLDNWRSRSFRPFMEELGITEKYTCNSGRHTFYTMNRRRNISPEIMMEVMGHEDYATGMENYNHWTNEDITKIYNAMVDLSIPA